MGQGSLYILKKILKNRVTEVSIKDDLVNTDFIYLEKYLDNYILRTFYSKKNSVYLIEYKDQKIVAKVFRTARQRFEFSLLNFLYDHDITIPKPYAMVNKTIFMEYLPGETFMDLINSNTLDKEKYIERLSEFFCSIHKLKKDNMSLLKGDFCIRNFIYLDKVYGLDFEESTYGNPLKDIGGAIAQILDSSPSFTEEKFYLSNYFIQLYLENSSSVFEDPMTDLKYFIIEGLSFDASFRPSQKEEINSWIQKIKENFDQIFDKKIQ